METNKTLAFAYNDGGRSKYFKAKKVGDCVTRAIAIATGKDYKEVYDTLYKLAVEKKRKNPSPRSGVNKKVYRPYLESLGWRFVPLMEIGKGCTNHLAQDEIPMDKTIICRVSGHLTCVVNGVINDTYDCSRKGTRCVYGYYVKD